MAPVRCFYRNCNKNSTTKSMFSFPVDEDVRLNAWIKNLDNDLLKTLTRQELRHRYICEDHFDAKDVLKHQFRSILMPNAVPLPFNFDTNKPKKPMIPRKCYYRNCRNTSTTHSLHRFPIKDEKRLRIWIKNSGNPKLTKFRPESLYTRNICTDHFDDCFKNSTDGQARLVRCAVPRPYKGDESNNIESEDAVETQCENSVNECDAVESRDTDTTYVQVFGSSCMECKKPIMGFGFQWWCLHCVGPRCSVCVMRLVHRPHFVLRLAAKIRPKQVEIVIKAIQKELQREGFFTTEEDKDWDQGDTADVDTDELEQILNEPSVKAEPPDEEEDPLAECFNSPDSQPKETPTIDCSFLAEHRPDSQSNVLRPGENSGREDSLETPTDIQSCPSRKDLHRPYRPSKSLGLVKSVQHGLSKKYSSVDNTECSSQKSSDPEVLIDYQPNEPTGLQVSIDYQSIDVPLGLEYSFELQSQFLGLYALYGQPDFDDIRHSASLNSASVGPVSHVPVGVLNPDKTGLKISGSGSGLGTPSVQSGSGLQKLVPGNQQLTIKDLNQNFKTKEDHMNEPHITQRLKNSVSFSHEDKKSRDNIKQQNNQTKTQPLLNQVYSGHKNQSSMVINERKDNKKLNTTQISKSDPNTIQESRIIVYSKHKKQNGNITEQKQAKESDSKTRKPQFQVYSTHKKLNCTDISDLHERKTASKMQQAIPENYNEIETQFQVYSTHKAVKPKI